MLVTTENTLDKIVNAVRDRLNILSLHAVVFKNKIPKVTLVLLKQNLTKVQRASKVAQMALVYHSPH